MDGFTGQNGGESLEERIRRMALFNSSVPDASEYDTTPRVRLPPTRPAHHQQQQAAGFPPVNTTHQRDGSWPTASPSPASPFNQQAFQRPMGPPGYKPPPPQAAPPHFQRFSANHHHGLQGPQHPGYHSQPPPQYHGPPPRGSGAPRGRGNSRQQRGQQIQLDPDAFQRGGPIQQHVRPTTNARHLFDPSARRMQPQFNHNDSRQRQALYLEQIASKEVANVEMAQAERAKKDSFRRDIEKLCHEVCDANPDLPKVSLECFGSFQSGFASAGSDMDLVIVVQDGTSSDACFSLLENDLPRELEKILLQRGHGARLLTRTRVPIIKVCQDPGSCLLSKLQTEREKWDFLSNEKKYPHLHQANGDDEGEADDDMPQTLPVAQADDKTSTSDATANEVAAAVVGVGSAEVKSGSVHVEQATARATTQDKPAEGDPSTAPEIPTGNETTEKQQQQTAQRRERDRNWTRERKAGPLDFPKDGVGIQCDINFFNPLGLHNTQMLRCYSLCDPRVRPIVLFVKSWAKIRRINSSYSGTLSSYGYVMMVLHYLMNVAQPPVLPNLQTPWRPNRACTPHGATRTEVDGWVVDFWRNEEEIKAAVQNGQMSANKQSIGSLLAGFFQYYSSMGNGPQFRWTQSVLSLRTPGGTMTKTDKGWVKAVTEEGEGKKIQHRYLFCIEDPFELSHNVARTVTHNGIVAIRDEFRRANRILNAIGSGQVPVEGELFIPLVEAQDANKPASIPNGDEAAANVKEVRPEGPSTNSQRKQSYQENLDGTADRPSSRGQRKTFDTADQNAFPSLGAASKANDTRRKKSNAQKEGGQQGFAAIDGKRAQAHLEEFRRKKVEAEAEHTAMGAAEAVLGDD